MKHVEYKSKCPPHAFPESRDPAEGYSKHSHRKSQSVAFGRSCRNPDTVASYYASATSYKPQKGYAGPSPTYSKYPSPHSPEMPHHGLQSHSKFCRDKHYPPNFPTVRKNRYGEEFGDSEKLKYVEEKLENFTDDNGEEEAEEEEDDREEPGDYLNKDYEEQEADDETDEESDASPQTHRAPRDGKKEALLREQRWRATEQQETRRLRCQQRGAMGQGHTSPSSLTRYYHDAVDHEVPELLSEEDFVPTSLKNPSRRTATDYHQWPQSRSESDRYDAAALAIPSSRRARTKPEIDHLIEAELSKTRKCNRCGNLSNKKSESPAKNCCRLDGRASFPTKGPIGDEPESHEQQFCGRYISRHSSKDANGASDIPTPLYSSKSRRSRDLKSPTIYEVPEQMEKLPDYPRSSPRYHRKFADVYPEKMKCSVHTSHGLPRISSRFEE